MTPALLLSIALLPFVLLRCDSLPETCAEIVSVGVCNRSGYCGVRLSNGDFKGEFLPVVGKQVCMPHAKISYRWESP